MGKFNNKVQAEFEPPRNWELVKVLSYQNDEMETEALESIGAKIKNKRVSVPKGFLTDLASVPRPCWTFLAPWDIARAAIIHDYLYSVIRKYRVKYNPWNDKSGYVEDHDLVKQAKEEADQIFLMAMIDADPSISKWKITVAYYAVSIFGRKAIAPREEDYN